MLTAAAELSAVIISGIDVYGRLLSASYCSIELSAIELKERATKKEEKTQIIHQTRFHIFMEIYENIFLFICV